MENHEGKEMILSLKNISKQFPGVLALDDVSFGLAQGEVHALVGENGAGKSTLIKIISGVYLPDSGQIELEGKEFRANRPQDAIDHGISTVHQELKMVESLSVAENIFLGHPILRKSAIGKSVNWDRMRREAKELVDSLGIKIDVNTKVEDLSVAQKQIVEICKALKRDAKLIIMDEPSATLTDTELDILFDIIMKLKKDQISIIYISHRLEEIFKIADTVTVLRDGKTIITDKVEKFDKNLLIKYMVGREIMNIYPEKRIEKKRKLLEVRNLSRKGVLHDISFDLYEGEILGIAGLVGSGRTELLRALFGVDKKTSGEVLIREKTCDIDCINKAIRQRMGFIPEERKLQGIIPEFTVAKNITLTGAKKILRRSFLSAKEESCVADRFIKQLRIATPSNKQLIRDLSGGNQQKCVLSKWLYMDPDIILCDEPTRGIDVGAKQEIYRILVDLAAQGKGIIVVSSELPEVLGISHRIIVMHDGRLTGELDGRDATQEQVMHYATM